jgi:hypothetical protein
MLSEEEEGTKLPELPLSDDGDVVAPALLFSLS